MFCICSNFTEVCSQGSFIGSDNGSVSICWEAITGTNVDQDPDSKVHGANMGPIWGLQDPGGPHELRYLGIHDVIWGHQATMS